MSDPFRPDDELVSAVLDGEATADERARVEADPVLSARLAEFRAIRDQIAAPVPAPDSLAAERAIEVAKVSGRAAAPVVPMRRRTRRSEVPRILATAAAVVLVLGSLGFLLSKTGGDDSGDASSDDALASADSGGDASAESADSAAGGGEAYDALTSFNGADLGDVTNEAGLRAAVERQGLVPATASDDSASTATTAADAPVLPQPEVSSETQGASLDCQIGLVEADAQLSGAVLAQATTTFAGTPAVVYVYGTPEGRQRIVVVSDDGCRILAAFDL